MTREEIKAQWTMKDILARYGMRPNRAGFIRCPFHEGDREASLKVYENDYNCFACGENGDIFTFVQKMEGLSFREAFLLLGGTYEKPSFSSRLAIYRAGKARERRLREEGRKAAVRELNNTLITVYRSYIEKSEPLSAVWCDCQNALQRQLYLHECLDREEDGKGAACRHGPIEPADKGNNPVK